ncbi:hypothetical protein HDF18_06080 [Mucilaginibacter sp. X5P1]|uniref:hypothetical protein n=1 Tax=Mucilaginibacter sp. X5P1 TaxID=2723088 RepID=UPI003B00656D
MDILESLTTSFRNIKNIVSKHFNHANTLTRRINLVIPLTQKYELGARNHMIKPPGISTLILSYEKVPLVTLRWFGDLSMIPIGLGECPKKNKWPEWPLKIRQRRLPGRS